MQRKIFWTLSKCAGAQSRVELICSAFEFHLPSCLNLEWRLDAERRFEEGRSWT